MTGIYKSAITELVLKARRSIVKCIKLKFNNDEIAIMKFLESAYADDEEILYEVDDSLIQNYKVYVPHSTYEMVQWINNDMERLF